MARQAWSRKNEWDRDALEHIRAMLLVLAALIERAAGLPFAERLRFLAVMGCGEAVRCGGRGPASASMASTASASIRKRPASSAASPEPMAGL